MLRKERHAPSLPSIVRGARLARSIRESNLSQSSGERITHSSEMRGNSDAPKGVACS